MPFADPPTRNKLDEAVEREYQTLYGAFPDRFDLKSLIDKESKDSERDKDRKLRIDACYLLLINFTEMIIRPAESAGKVPLGTLREATANDIRIIVQEAAKRAETEEISGHQVIDVLANSWRNLKTTAFNIWD
jgi:hypothetical protein